MFFISMCVTSKKFLENQEENQLFAKQLRELVGYFAGIEDWEVREDVLQMVKRIVRIEFAGNEMSDIADC